MPKPTAVVSPNLGIYLDRPKIALSERMLQDGRNFRVKEGMLSNLNLGWTRFEEDITLNGAVLLIDSFFIRGQSEKLIFASPTDLYQYNASTHLVTYITPIYATGTASASGTAVTGIGTLWDTGTPKNAKPGDQIHFGSATQTSVSATWFTIDTVNSDTSITLTASAGVIGAGAYTIRRRFTGDAADIWITDTFVNASPSTSDEWWATNGVDHPIRWNGTSTGAEIMNTLSFTSCKSLRVYRNMMIFANLIQAGASLPTDIVNSNVGEPQNTSSGLSEQFKVHSNTDGIQGMKPIGDALAIYSESTLTIAQFVGDPLIFVFRNAISDIGAIAPRAIADHGDYHEFLGADSQYRFDGATVKEIGKQIWRETLRQQDPTRIRLAYHHFDDENGDLIWSVPSTVDPGSGTETSPPTKAIGEHYLEDVGENVEHPASIRDIPFTAMGYYSQQEGLTWDELTESWAAYNFRWNDQFFFAAFPLNMGGDANGKLYTVNTSQDADGVALPSFVTFGRRAVADGKMRGLVRRIYPFVAPFTNPLNVTLCMSDHAMGVDTTTDVTVFDQNLVEGGHFVSPFRRGRFMELEFGTDGPGEPWEVSGYDLDLDSGGRR